MFSAVAVVAVTICGLADAVAPAALTYEEFGAVGDGKADDLDAIIATHAAANSRGLPVRAKDGATYYIGQGGKTAVIRTDVDFGTAKFVIDDTKVEMRHIKINVFCVAPDEAAFPVSGIASLARGQADIGVKLPKDCMVHLKNDKVKRFIRWGGNRNNGTAQTEVVLVNREGRVDPSTPVMWDYDTVTEAIARPVDGRAITLEGGVFTTVANQAESRYTYYRRGMQVMRSNVRIEGVRHLVTGELDHGAPYAGFICISDCAHVTVTGCVFTARRTYKTIGNAGVTVSMGSYGISVGNAIDVRFLNCSQTTDIVDGRYWGLFGSNYCRNLLFDGCEFSRFDAHQGVANATIRNSTLGYMGVQAIGGGTLLVENSTVRSRNAFINLRTDYGSSWDGDIIIRNCTFAPCNARSDAMPPIIGGRNVGAHDYGYACRMPRRIIIDGLKIDDSGRTGDNADTYIFAPFDRGSGEVRPYPVTEEVTLRNVETTSGRQLKVSKNMRMFGGVKVSR